MRFTRLGAFSTLLLLPCVCADTAFAAGAPPAPTTHTLKFSNATEIKDAKGRLIISGQVSGDIEGTLTIALVLSPTGTVSGGEWALNASTIVFGAIDKDGDGDRSEFLKQRGVIKGTVTSGGATLASTGLATAATGLLLKVTGATVEFAAVTSGTGSFVATALNARTTSTGSLSLSF